jgi:hemoglobin/transferrin/lactoferrin receptor protein
MKKIFILWLLLGVSVFGHTQVITINDSRSGQPLELVTLASNDPRAFAMTNSEGQADITAFQQAERIELRLIGYKTMIMSFGDITDLGFSLEMVPTSITLDQVVVSATRWNQPRREIPARITSITTGDVALQNPQTAADLLNTSGEVFIQKSQQGGGSPMIRGFSTNRLLYTVDGVRMNTAIFRSGNLQNVISLDPFAIENTEVFFGPGSIIYGSDAIGAVMSFQTLTPQFSLSTKKPLIAGGAEARYSSANNEMTGHFHINVGWKKFAMLTSFSINDYGDLRMGRHGPDEYLRNWYVQRLDSMDVVMTNTDPQKQVPTGYQQINLMQKFRYSPNDEWNLEYGFHYSATTDYSRYDRLIRTHNGLPRSAEWKYGPQVWMMNNLTVTHRSYNTVYDQMIIRLAHQYFEESRIDRDFNDPERRTRLEKVNAFSMNLDFAKTVGEKSTFLYGAEAVINDVASTGTDEDIATGEVSVGPSRYPMSTWSSYAAYLTYEFKVNEKVGLNAGARYNQYVLDADFSNNKDFYPFPFTTAKINDGALTGTLGVVYNPTDKWSLYLDVATGFRAPNVDDVGKVFDSEPGSVVVPNPDLKAEYAYNAEVGVAKVFDDVVKIDLTAYYTILNNAMVRRDFSLNGQDSIIYDGELSQVQAIQNAAIARVFGIQAGLEVKIPGGFGISSHFNYQQGEEELDDGTTSPLRHAPPWFGITHFTFGADKLKLDLYAVYNGEVSYENMPEEEKGKDYMYAADPNGNPYSPGWYTLNFKAMYYITDNFSVSAGVENLTDQRYRPYSSGIAAPGRNFILSIRAEF